MGNVTSGSGFSLGPGYRHTGMFGGHADFSTFAAASLKKYWMIDARLQMPRLADNRAGVEVYGRTLRLSGRRLLRSRTRLAPRERSHLRSGQHRLWRDRHLSPDTVAERSAAASSTSNRTIRAETGVGEILSIFDRRSCPARWPQPDIIRYQASVDVNTRQPRGNPRRGGRYALTYQRFDDSTGGRFSFDRVEVDLQQYIPLLRDRRVLALHALVSTSEADEGRRGPVLSAANARRP